ncbi:MAG: ATP-grasp domain-containing protein, partial [Phycisphaerales bacterium]
MARLHEYQGKDILKAHGIATPRGGAASTPEQAAAIAASIGARVIVKIQAFTTNRKALGGVAFADTPTQAAQHAARMLGMHVGNFAVEQVLIEEALPIRDELFVSLYIDDRERAPAMLLSLVGGSGIEERAREHGSAAVAKIACDVETGPDLAAARSLLGASKIAREYHGGVLDAVRRVFDAARACEARSVEINPLVTVEPGGSAGRDSLVYAAACRGTIDV